MTGWQRAEVGTFSDYFRLLGRICVFRLVLCHTALLGVRVHVSSHCGRSEEVRDRHAITFWSRVTGWQRGEVGTVSDVFRLLGRMCVLN